MISADEKTSIQARQRCHPTLAPASGRDTRVEHEYDRGGALAYLAAWDVHAAKVFGRCEPTPGIEPFGRLVEQVMGTEPYASARRVFWVVDNGSSHRGQAAVDRMRQRWPNAHLVQLPVHASWLNQVEIYFSVVQRKVLRPTTSLISPRSSPGWPRSSVATSRRLCPSSGGSPAPTSPSCSSGSPTSPTTRPPHDHARIRDRNSGPEHLAPVERDRPRVGDHSTSPGANERLDLRPRMGAHEAGRHQVVERQHPGGRALGFEPVR